ncbi:mitochondrial ribosomal protein S11 [Arctopsyche grandis]|uniref:mitochondrial ribosomal protein S11 n=1 Tax=Arctopsyche grandis TaxID=121162 RepID=UPI00406D747D
MYVSDVGITSCQSRCEFEVMLRQCWGYLRGAGAPHLGATSSVSNIFQTRSYSRHERTWSYKTLPAQDEGTAGEKAIDLDANIIKHPMFPDETSHLRIFDGVPFNQLAVCDIKASKNNTIMTISNYKGTPQIIRSCGIEGFKTARKGTNIAAQATAISLSALAIPKGITTIRVRVQGLGPGRMAAIKGLQMGGMNVVSITDTTRVSWNPPRPRKARRV